jgi:hypothetical protein
MTTVQTLTLFIGLPAPYYLFLSILEIAATALIVGYAWKWRKLAPAVQPRVAGVEARAKAPTV